MKLIVVSGRSGSGKSTALHALEDQGYHCIDNLPVSLLPALVDGVVDQRDGTTWAVGIDARNMPAELDRFPDIYEALRARHGEVRVEILYLDADPTALVRRFSETRRRHPLTDDEGHLAGALAAEQVVLASIAERADLVVDTTHMTVHGLREVIRERVAASGTRARRMSLLFRSFGFKSGVPVDADHVFDVRCLPNPHWEPELREHTGQDPAVALWLSNHEDVQAMEQDVRQFVERWLPAFEANNRSYLTVAIGCTGGQHRSVYLVERLASHFAGSAVDVLVHHRELDLLRRLDPARVAQA